MALPSSVTLESNDLLKNSTRLARLRWLAGFGLLALTPANAMLVGVQLPVPGMYILGIAILLYNGLLWWGLRSPDPHRIQWIGSFQVALDWLALAVLVHLTGGVESLAMNFYLFYVLLAPIFLPGRWPYLFVALVVATVAGVIGLEAATILPHYRVRPALPPGLHQDALYIAGKLFFFTTVALVLGSLVIPIIHEFRERERHVTGLYEIIQHLSRSLELSHVLDRLASSITLTLKARGTAIRLMDEVTSRPKLAATYGLSQQFVRHHSSDDSFEEIERLVTEGQLAVSQNVATDTRLTHTAQLLGEGIHSALCVPLTGQRGPVGMLHVFGRTPNAFGEAETGFVTTIASQGANAIENALIYASLRRADQMKSRFVRAVTHELRSPVVGAQSLLRSVMHTSTELTDMQHEILRRLSARLDVLHMLINDLLDLAAGKFEGQDSQLQPVSLEEVALDVIETLQNQALEKRIVLSMNYVPRGLTVTASREGLERIFLNLIGNAIKYTPDGGRVCVTLERRDSVAAIEVADTGIGIPEGDLPHLFDEFFRARNVKEANIPGTGLGLAIVKDLIECYKGRISVRSQAGHGTTFTVTLPLLST